MSGYADFSLVYDTLTENADYPGRAAYILKLLEQSGVTGGLLLDLACGTGRLGIELSKAGFEVIGVDASEDMLGVAAENAAEAEQSIMLLCQDMKELDLYGTVNAAVCALDSINHLTKLEDVSAALRRLSLFIEPGGVFVFDVNTLYKHRRVLADNTFVYDLDDVYCVWQNTLEDDGRTVDIDLDFFVYNESEDSYYRSGESFSERAYTLDELTDALKDAGFTVSRVCGELSLEPPAEDEQRIFIVAERK